MKPWKVTITDANGCSISKILNVAQSAELWITDELSYCEPEVLLSAPLAGTYEWSNGKYRWSLYGSPNRANTA